MSHVSINKYKSSETVPQTLLQSIEGTLDSIRSRAFALFQNRNGTHGSDVEDWVQAERDVVWSPAAELVDNAKEFKARMAVPGFDAKEIRVSATPDALIIQAEASHTHDRKDGNVRFCEFSAKQLFRRLPLPESVDVEKVTASLDKGILQVIAPKTTSASIAAGA